MKRHLLLAGFGGLCLLAPVAAQQGPPPSLSEILAIPESPESPLKDPFRPPSTVLPESRESAENKKTVPELPKLLLTAVLQGPGRTAAVVNGTILRTGDTYLDMQVLEISKNRVLFQRGEGKVTLFMQENLYNPLSLGGK